MKIFIQPRRGISARIIDHISSVTNRTTFLVSPTGKKDLVRRLNLTFALLLTAFLQIGLAARAQNVTLSKDNATLVEVFKEIQRQTSYNFLYTAEMLHGTVPVSVQLSNASLEIGRAHV